MAFGNSIGFGSKSGGLTPRDSDNINNKNSMKTRDGGSDQEKHLDSAHDVVDDELRNEEKRRLQEEADLDAEAGIE